MYSCHMTLPSQSQTTEGAARRESQRSNDLEASIRSTGSGKKSKKKKKKMPAGAVPMFGGGGAKGLFGDDDEEEEEEEREEVPAVKQKKSKVFLHAYSMN